MRFWGISVVGAVCLLLAYSGNGLQAAEPGERIGDWFYKCGPATEPKKSRCYISQTVENLKGKQSTRLLLTNVGYFFSDEKLWLVTFLPLETWKVAVQQQFFIDVDKEPLLQGKVDTCFRTGCRTGFLIEGNSLMALKKGKVAVFSFVTLQGKKVRIGISLKGFARALKTLG